jgi:hypothetical protein
VVCATLLASLVVTTTGGHPAGAQEDPAAKLSPALATIAANDVGVQSTEDLSTLVGLPPEGAGSLLEHHGGFLVYVQMDPVTPDGIAAIEAAGATVVHVSDRYQVVTAAVTPGVILPVAEVPTVGTMSEALEPMVSRAPAAARTQEVGTAVATCPTGVVSEGDTQLRAALGRSTFGVDGSGITIGVLSDSFNKVSSPTSWAGDIAAGELPGPSNPCGFTTADTIKSDYAGGTDEGRAMAQAIHDLAPGAHVVFRTAFNGLFAFADEIYHLRVEDDADIIVDDVVYLAEPFFQDGPVAVAVNDVVANGAVYFSAAGNGNETVGTTNVSAYETPAFRPAPCPSSITSYLAPNYASAVCHDFDTTGGVDVGWDFSFGAGSGELDLLLQWSEPWHGVTDDFTVFLLNPTTNAVVAHTHNDSNVTMPADYMKYTNVAASSWKVVIARKWGSGTPRMKFLLGGSRNLASVQYTFAASPDLMDGSSIFGHAGSASAIAVGAVPYDNSETAELFTSHGHVTHYWGPVTGIAPAAALGSPDAIAKPQVAATDGGRNSFFGSNVGGVWRFYGASQSAPHAAAVGALMLQRAPSLTPADVLNTMAGSVAEVPAAPHVAVGAGLLDAYAAVLAVGDEVKPPPPTNVTATAGNGQAAVSWLAPPVDGGAAITDYTVTSSPEAKTCFVTDEPLTCTITGLTNGTAYTFTVVATNGIGPSNPSSPSAAVTPSVPVISVVRGGDGAMYWQRLSDTTSTAWASRGGGTSSRPTVTSNGTTVWAFVRGNDGTPYFQRSNGSTWTNWIGLGGFLKSDPIVVVSDGQVWVAGVGGDNGVYWGRVNVGDVTGSTWSGWTGLGGGASANPALTPDGSGVVIVVRGLDGTPYHQKITVPSGGSGWASFGGGIQGSPAAVTESGGRISVFVRGNDNRLYRRVRTDATTWTGSWAGFDGAWSTAPAAVADASGVSVVLNSTGGTPNVVRFAANGGALSTTVSLGGLANGDPAITTDGVTSWVFIRGGDFQSYWRRGTGSTWPGTWTPTGGFLTSALSSGTSS